MNTPEHDLQDEIRVALSQRGHLVTRVNAGTSVSFDGRRIIQGAPPGTADLVVCVAPEGRYLELEVKAPRGRQSPEQQRRQTAVWDRGGGYQVVRSVAEALAACELGSRKEKAMGERLTVDPAICFGKPSIRGTRYSVEMILELLDAGMSDEEILRDYPIEQGDLDACREMRPGGAV